jgi:hypothetical protein
LKFNGGMKFEGLMVVNMLIMVIWVGFEVLTVVSTKMDVFWVVPLCSLVEVYQHFRGPCCLHHHGPDNGGSKDLWNVGKLPPDYMVLQPRKQPSSWSAELWHHVVF